MKIARLVLLLSFTNLLFFVSCSKKDEIKPETPFVIDSINVKKIDPYIYSDSVLNKKSLLALYDEQLKSFTGIFAEPNYGVGFFIINPFDSLNHITYKSPILDGILEGSEVDVITLNNNDRYLYYSSGSAFIGSRNLEVYQYLFNPTKKLLFTSYATLSEDGTVSIIYSNNLKKNNETNVIHYFQSQIQNKFIDDLSERRVRIGYE